MAKNKAKFNPHTLKIPVKISFFGEIEVKPGLADLLIF
jgi:hypothetical protein